MTLPAEFADLEPYLEWDLATEPERYAKRLASSMTEMQAFYDVAFPRLNDVIDYCDKFPLDDLPEDARTLMHLMQSLVMVSFPIEAWKQPRVPDSGATLGGADPGAGDLDGAHAEGSGAATSTPARSSRPAFCALTGTESSASAAAPARCEINIDLGDQILLPGLMDMEVNLLMGGRGEKPGLSRSRTTRRRGSCARWAMRAAPCAPGSPPCATSDCSSRPAAICWTSPWARLSTQAGSMGRG